MNPRTRRLRKLRRRQACHVSPERGTGLHAWYVRNGIYGAIAEMRVHNARIARVIEMFQFFEGQQSSLLAQIGRNIPIF